MIVGIHDIAVDAENKNSKTIDTVVDTSWKIIEYSAQIGI